MNVERIPAEIVALPGVESQFYSKVFAHEQEHLSQWTDQEPWKNLYDVSTYREAILAITSTVSAQDLFDKVGIKIAQLGDQDKATSESTRCQREKLAYVISNQLPPDYLEPENDAAISQLYACEF